MADHLLAGSRNSDDAPSARRSTAVAPNPSPSNVDDELKKAIRRAMGGRTIAQDLTQEERTRFAELKARVEMFNRAIPELRIKLHERSMSIESLLSVDLKICIDYYSRCAGLRFEKDGGNKIAERLISLLEQHPVEWEVCSWKNDFIAEIMLGQLKCFNEKPDQLASNWLKSYWRRERKLKKGIELDVSPKRTAAWSAVHELDFLMFIDQLSGMFDSPGFRDYAALVRWLNKNWFVLAGKKKGQALLEEPERGVSSHMSVLIIQIRFELFENSVIVHLHKLLPYLKLLPEDVTGFELPDQCGN